MKQWEKEGYCELLDTNVRTESEYFSENASFRQDGAAQHTSHYARDLLRDIFEENWIGKYYRKTGPLDHLIYTFWLFCLKIC